MNTAKEQKILASKNRNAIDTIGAFFYGSYPYNNKENKHCNEIKYEYSLRFINNTLLFK